MYVCVYMYESHIAGGQVREHGHGKHGARVSPPGGRGTGTVLFVDLAVAWRSDTTASMYFMKKKKSHN